MVMKYNIELVQKLSNQIENERLEEALFHGHYAVRGHWSYVTGFTYEQRKLIYFAYVGNVNKALTLFCECFPEYQLNIEFYPDDNNYVTVIGDDYMKILMSSSKTLSRAILLATLKTIVKEGAK